jgi:hypothetical protein
MDIQDRIRTLFPHALPAEIERWVKAGREYADRLDMLPANERESVAQLFACYGMTPETHYKRAFRKGIDAVIRPWYPAAGVDNAPAA